MSERWVNIYPLMKSYEALISTWINARYIDEIDFAKYEGKWVICLHVDRGTVFREEYDTEEEALKVWEALKAAVGTKIKLRRGRKKRNFEVK